MLLRPWLSFRWRNLGLCSRGTAWNTRGEQSGRLGKFTRLYGEQGEEPLSQAVETRDLTNYEELSLFIIVGLHTAVAGCRPAAYSWLLQGLDM